MLRSAVNVKQRDFFFSCVEHIVIKDTVSNQHIPCRISQLLIQFSGFVKELVRLMLFAGQPCCFLPHFYCRPPTSTLLCVFLNISYNHDSPFETVNHLLNESVSIPFLTQPPGKVPLSIKYRM